MLPVRTKKRLDSFLSATRVCDVDYASSGAEIDDDDRWGTKICGPPHSMNECEIARHEATMAVTKDDGIRGA